MARLTQRDLRNLLEGIGELYSHRDLETFGERALGISRRLMPCAYGTYNGINYRRKTGWYVTDPASLELGLGAEGMRRMVEVHPLIRHHCDTGDGAARMLSDFLSPVRYRESVLYREFFRELGVEAMICVWLPERPPDTVAIALIRDRGAFTERERLILNLLRPHLFRAYRNAEAIARLQETARLSRVLEATRQGVIVLDSRHRVKFRSAKAREWISRYLAPPARLPSHLLPAALQRWVLRQQPTGTQTGAILPPRSPLVLDGAGSRLAIRLVPGSSPGEQVLLLEEQQTTPSPAPLRQLGLTEREAEILFWVAQGKTSPELAVILGCATATVNKHLEHIRQKLGVETRTAAAARAFELLGALPS